MSASPISHAAKVAALVLGVTAVAACSDSSGPSGPHGTVRFINAAPQVAQADLHVGTTNSADNIGFGRTTQFSVSASGTAQVFTAYPGTGTTSLGTQSVTVANGKSYTLVLAQSTTASATTELLYFPDTVSAPSSGKAKLRVVNTSPSVASFDVYVLNVGSTTTDLTAATPLSTASVQYKTAFPYTEVTSGAHRIVLTTAGTKNIVSDVATFTFTAGKGYTFLTLDKAGGGAPVSTISWSER